MFKIHPDSSDSIPKDQNYVPWKPELVLSVCLSSLYDHDCLLPILEFLSWEALNTFAFASKGCHMVRSHSSLDQTRSGTIRLGKGVSNAMELMNKVREEHWSDAFCGHRTHLRLSGLTHLSSDIDPIDEDFIRNVASLKQVTSLDCSIVRDTRFSSLPWLAPFEDFVGKGFAQGLTLSLLVPNLREINMSYVPLSLLGVAWIAENNPKLEVIRWNRSLVWPVNNETCNHLEACRNLKEIYLDHARMIFCSYSDSEESQDLLWTSLAKHNKRLERISIRGTQWYGRGQKITPFSQDSLMKFVRCTPSLRWFRSDLLPENVAILNKECPNVMFSS
jgi:hypothetical protein